LHSPHYIAQSTRLQYSITGQLLGVPRTWILRQVSDGAGAGYLALSWNCLAGQRLGESSFTRPITAHQTNPVAFSNANRDIAY
jgi:hypothetical protein